MNEKPQSYEVLEFHEAKRVVEALVWAAQNLGHIMVPSASIMIYPSKDSHHGCRTFVTLMGAVGFIEGLQQKEQPR